MKKTYLYIIIAILVFIILSLLTYEKNTEIVFKEDIKKLNLNFGTIDKKRSKSFNYRFKYTNKLYDSLKIYKVIDACDCTESSVKSGIYFKNDTIFINTIYNPHKYNDSGFLEKKIYLVTNKTLTEFDTILPLTLRGYVK